MGAALLLAQGVTAMAIAAPTSAPAATAAWPDDRVHRLAALALLEQLQTALLTEDSATLTLERWCRTHRIAEPAQIVADRDPGLDRPIDDAQRRLLALDAGQAVRYRHVRLSCGPHLLSEADNWYVPARLTAPMNQTLDDTHVPFGKAVAALRFTRSTLSSRLLWSPLPADWTETAQAPTAGALHIPDALIENRAILRDQDGRPFSLVVETYRAGVLAFPPPPPDFDLCIK